MRLSQFDGVVCVGVEEKTLSADQGEKNRLRFEFIKGNSFRVIHADGAFGGVTPQQSLLITFYNERLAIPTAIVHEVLPDGKLGEEIRTEREGRDAVVREVEVGVVLSLDVTKQLLEWLKGKIKEMEGLRAKDNQ